MTILVYTRIQLILFDKRSDENMLIYYKDEMLRIAEGESPSTFLSKPQINRFVEKDILERSCGEGGWKLRLGPKGREWYGLPSS